jgi:benzoyl-CoA reductase/2-hydroxyglutaryl-CoA dehydratase subunit BcrC/BadD/HgdB
MTNEWMEMAGVLENRHVKEWKAGGGKVIGYTCSYLPDELFHAAGILPFRIRGHGATECTIGDTYFGPFICSLPKAMLQLAGEGRFKFLDGVIITPGCDSMRRLDECWRKAGGDIDGILPKFFFHFGVPHKYSEYTIKWFTDEIRRLGAYTHEAFGVKITDAKLNESIRVYNRGRELMREFDRLRMLKEPPVTGAEALAVIIAGTAMPKEAHNGELERLIETAGLDKRKNGGRVRLMLVGSANDDVELVSVIEGEKALVVADNLCFSSRFHLDPVPEGGDPVLELAKWYLKRNECPRMYGGYRDRLDLLKAKIKEAKVEGVVLQNIRFCDLHGAENGLFEKDLEAQGIPCVKVEREYGPLVEKGRLKIRIDAFLERILKKRGAAA